MKGQSREGPGEKGLEARPGLEAPEAGLQLDTAAMSWRQGDDEAKTAVRAAAVVC